MKHPVSPLLFLLVATTSWAQSTDTTFLADARKNAVRVYTTTVGVGSQLFNGSEYKEYRSQKDEFPYLFDDLMFGDIKFGGELYEGVPLYYDLVSDQVITSYPQGHKIQLTRNKVDYFDIGDHRVVRLNNNQLTEGFYDQLYDGKMKLYARRQKVLITKINGNVAENDFELRVKYYLLRNGSYRSIKSKGSILSILKDRKKELKRMLKEEKLRSKENREKAMARMLAVYEQLNP